MARGAKPDSRAAIAGAVREAAAQHAANAPAAIPAGPTATMTATAGGGGSPSAAPASYGVDLQHTIEAVHATIELAAHQGLAQARIALQPDELGEIRIHLSQSAQGLIARVTADTPAAAQALAAGHAELRQSLGSLNLAALHLDTPFGPHDFGSSAGFGAQSGGHGSPREAFATDTHGSPRLSDVGGDDPDDTSDPLTDSTTPRLARGALVDVLA